MTERFKKRSAAERFHDPELSEIVVRDNSVNAKLRSMFELEGIDHVALSVGDIERSAQWYIEVLGFERRHEGMWNGVPTFIGKGTIAIALFPARTPNSKTAAHKDKIDPPIGRIRSVANMLHLAFRADCKNFLAAREELKRRGIKFHFQDHEICHSIYFRDPNGHELEITTYELR